MSATENIELYNVISNNFELGLENGGEISIAEIKARVQSVVRELLDKNMEKLMSILYIIDVPQTRTDEIMNRSSKDDIAVLLADEIIARQLKKIETRTKYRKKD